MIGQIYYTENGVFKLVSYVEGIAYKVQKLNYDDFCNIIELDIYRDLTVDEFKKLEKITNEFKTII